MKFSPLAKFLCILTTLIVSEAASVATKTGISLKIFFFLLKKTIKIMFFSVPDVSNDVDIDGNDDRRETFYNQEYSR